MQSRALMTGLAEEGLETAATKESTPTADLSFIDAAERNRILGRYAEYVRRWDAAAERRRGNQEPVPVPGPSLQEEQLAPRELEVLKLVATGMTDREIGKRLELSEQTVKSYLRNLLRKLEVRSRAHAVAVAFRRGLLC